MSIGIPTIPSTTADIYHDGSFLTPMLVSKHKNYPPDFKNTNHSNWLLWPNPLARSRQIRSDECYTTPKFYRINWIFRENYIERNKTFHKEKQSYPSIKVSIYLQIYFLHLFYLSHFFFHLYAWKNMILSSSIRYPSPCDYNQMRYTD